MRRTKTFFATILSALLCLLALAGAWRIAGVSAKADNASDVAAAKEAGKYHELDIGFAMPYQHTGWGYMKPSTPVVAIYIKGAEGVSFKTGSYDISAKGYVYVSDDVNSEGTDKGSGVFGVDGRGENGWAIINLNLSKRYKRVTLKSGLIIKAGTEKSEVYELTEDYVLYDVNNTYIGGKTIEEALENSQDLVTYYDRKILSITKSGDSLMIKYDSSLGDLGVGAPASISFDKIAGENGGTWQTFGGYFETGSKQQVMHNVTSFTLAENEKFTIKAGFLTCFWAESYTKIYVIRTTEDFYAKYSGGSIVSLGDNEKYVTIAKAAGKYHKLDIGFAMPYQNTSWGMSTSDSLIGLYIKGAEDVSFQTGDYAIDAKGYVYVSDDVNSEGTDKGNGVYGFANRGGNGWAFINLNLSKRYKRVTLKAGMIIRAGTGKEEVYELTEDYVLYDVNNTYIAGKTIEEALENANDMVTYFDREITGIQVASGSITFEFDFALNDTLSGAPAFTSVDFIVGSKGTEILTFGGYFNTATKKNTTHNVISGSFAEGEIVTVEAGFKVCFWAENNTKIYVIRTTEKVAYKYVDGKFVAASAMVTIKNGDQEISEKIGAGENYTIPKLADMGGKTFLGVTDEAGKTYFAGDVIENVAEDTVLNAVYVDFTMRDGASVRIGENIGSSGIRFMAYIGKNLENIKGAGILVIPEDLLNGELTKNCVVADETLSALDFYWNYSDIGFETENQATLRATIATVRQINYNRNFVARGYIVAEIDGVEKIIYADQKADNVRTVYYVAKEAVEKDEKLTAAQKAVAKGYTDSVLAVSESGGVYVAENDGVTNINVSVANNVATITATTATETYYGLIFGGVSYSYKEITQSHADGVITLRVTLHNFAFGIGEVLNETRGTGDPSTTGKNVAMLSDKMGSDVQRVWIQVRKICSRDDASNKIYFNAEQVKAYKNYFSLLKANGVQKIIAMSNEYLLPYGYNPWSAYAGNGNVVPYGGGDSYTAWLSLVYEYYYGLARLFPEIDYFEVENEVNFSVYYETNEQDTSVYIKANGDKIGSDGVAEITADIMFYATKAVKAVNSENKVLFPGLAAGDSAQIDSAKTFLNAVYAKISDGKVANGTYEYSTDFNDYFEILAVHPYPYKDGNVTQWVKDLNGIYGVCTNRGHKVRVWMTEFGVPYDGGATTSSWTEEQLNGNLTKYLDEINKLEYVDAVVWFRLCDLYVNTWNERENIMGLFYSIDDPEHQGAAKDTAKLIYLWLYGKEMQ